MSYQIKIKEGNRGSIITPFSHEIYGKHEILEVNFNEIYKGMFSFARYGVIQFNIKSDNTETAIEMAKERLNHILRNGFPKRDGIVVVSGFRYDENNNKKPYNLSFMENTHTQNQFTANSYKTKAGDLLRYDTDGDGYGFWYAVDIRGKRISGRLKGGILTSYLSDGVVENIN
jgi:hypothetical protein